MGLQRVPLQQQAFLTGLPQTAIYTDLVQCMFLQVLPKDPSSWHLSASSIFLVPATAQQAT